MISSLANFLMLILYHGLNQRVSWTLLMYTMGAVCVARIAIEQSRQYSVGYLVALALAAFVVMSRFVVGSILFCAGILALIAYLSDRIVHDCTLIDDSQDASGQGLIEFGRSKLKQQLQEPATDGQGKPTANKAGHQPGRTVMYLALGALPLFGVGQFLLRSDAETWHSAQTYLAVYLFSSLSLLVTTSFLGLRRYLRQRQVDMPADVTVAWLVGGLAMIGLILSVAYLAPMPGQVLASIKMPEFLTAPKDLQSSSMGWGNEGANQAKPNSQSTDDKDSEGKETQGIRQQQGAPPGQAKDGNAKNGPTGKSDGGKKSGGKKTSDKQDPSGKKSSGEKQPGAKQEGAKQSPRGKNEQPSQQQSPDNGKPKPAESQSKSNDVDKPAAKGQQKENSQGEESQGENSKSGKQDAQPPSDGKKDPDQKSSEKKSPEQKDQNDDQKNDPPSKQNSPPTSKESPNQESSNKNDSASSNQPDSQSQSSPPPSSSPSSSLGNFFSALGGIIRFLIMAALFAVVAVFVYWYRDAMIDWWNQLWNRDTPEFVPTSTAAPDAAIQPLPIPFSAFRNPIGSEKDPRKIVVVTFQAFEAWTREQGWNRDKDETPSEFIRRVAHSVPGAATPATQIVDAYNRIVYGRGKATKRDMSAAKLVWQAMQQ